MNRRLLATLSLSAIVLTGCTNVATESKPSPTSTSSGTNAVESGIKLQEKAKNAAETLNEDPLKDLEGSEAK